VAGSYLAFQTDDWSLLTPFSFDKGLKESSDLIESFAYYTFPIHEVDDSKIDEIWMSDNAKLNDFDT
jgi:hypothetical protein